MFLFNFASFYSIFVDPLLRDVRAYVPQFVGLKAGDRVLDVACGTGAQAGHYAMTGIIATGVDQNPDMIKMAEKKARKHGLSNAYFQVASALKLPFKDGLFDGASISLALHENESSDKDRILSEMKRVVKKGGFLALIDFSTPLPRRYRFLIDVAEFLNGWHNYQCFREFIKSGGLDELVKRNHLEVKKRGHLKGASLTLVVAENL